MSDAPRVDVEGFEGPLDLLLQHARAARVDLREIRLLDLVEQCLAYLHRLVEEAGIGDAADTLVTAAWLAELKSRLLLPAPPEPEEPQAPAWDPARLEAMREAAAALLDRPRLGLDVFARGAPEAGQERRELRLVAELHDLLAAYAQVRTRDDFRPYAADREGVVSMEEALATIRPRLPGAPWAELPAWMPEAPAAAARSALAATFAAALELVRQGEAEIRQEAPFAPLHLRGRSHA